MKKRILSFVLCIVMIFSASALPATAATPGRGLIGSIRNGYPMSNLADILTGIYQINTFINKLTGIPIFSEEKFVVTVDDKIQGIIDNIIQVKGVDFSEVYENLPSLSRSADIITSTLKINVPEFQKVLSKLSDKLYENNNPVLGFITNLYRVWLGVIDDCQLKLTPVDGRPGVFRFDAVLTYRDGRKDTLQSNIYFDENTNEICGADGGPAILGFSMDMDQMYTYTGVNVWQRYFGFCFEYDLFCYLTPYIMNYTTQRIKFEYDNREWMCQIWKGTYFITNGGEVGFYTRPLGSIGTFYRCISDEDMMYMTLNVYHKDQLLLSRGPVKHWWVTGFEVDSVCYLPQTLTLVSTITMKDEEMLKAFKKALKKKFLVLDYEVDGLDVTITW